MPLPVASVRRSPLLAGLVLAGVLASVLAAPPARAEHRDSRYCVEERDYCVAAYVADGVHKLRISSAPGTFAGRYRVCVTGPQDLRECREFRMERFEGVDDRSRDIKRWRRHFTHQGIGDYKVTWYKFGGPVGPTLGFHVKSAPAGDSAG